MRIDHQTAKAIAKLAQEIFGQPVEVRLFGSRIDDQARGGDLDIYIESRSVVDQPAYLSSVLAARVSRLLNGRSVDVLLKAPNLKETAIHRIAKEQGELL
jgi:predicted nucleotidyltransferase